MPVRSVGFVLFQPHHIGKLDTEHVMNSCDRLATSRNIWADGLPTGQVRGDVCRKEPGPGLPQPALPDLQPQDPTFHGMESVSVVRTCTTSYSWCI